VRIAKEELEMAARLVEKSTGSFRPDRFKDTYRNALRRIIRAKERGEAVSVAEPAEPEEEPTDLMAALPESVESAKKRRGRKANRPKRRAA
jgi:DNA end-binding protein Ku